MTAKAPDPFDPKGLMREAFRMDGIGLAECRSIFVDWALSLPPDVAAEAAMAAMLARYAPDAGPHPMADVLRSGMPGAPGGVASAQRRGGAAGRRGEPV